MAAVMAGLWDMKVQGDDVSNPNNPFEWSQDFRYMLGFTDENDFPNRLDSWSNLLHPDHKDPTLKAFADALNDTSGMTVYDVEYQLKRKDGTYHWYRAAGDAERDENGKPVRIVGLLYDIGQERATSGDTEWRNNAAF